MAGYEAYQERFVRIETDVSELRHDLAAARQDIRDLKRDVGEVKRRLSAVERDTDLLKWMVGFTLALAVALKLFLH
jgi:chromosome segregation ATPase